MKLKDIYELDEAIDEITDGEYTLDDAPNGVRQKDKFTVTHNECGNVYETTPYHFFKRGQRCRKCHMKSIQNNTKTTDTFKEEVFKLVKDAYTVIGEYTRSNEKIKMKHNECGHIYDVRPNNFLRGDRCPKCRYSNVSNNMTKDTKWFKDRIYNLVESEYSLLDEYINSNQKIKMKHNECGHTYEVTPNNFTSGWRCPKCSNKVSNFEIEVYEYIKSIYKDTIIQNHRIDRMEIDIYLPKLNIGVECNGLYWHSDKFKDRNYHINKTKFFNDTNIRLIHVNEDEWFNSKEIVKSKLKHIMNLNTSGDKIYARKCIIKEVNSKDKNKFLNSNHIQGADKSRYKLGLYYNDVLVSVMTFAPLRKALGNDNVENGYELVRYASDKDSIIIGGFSKLFNHFVKTYNVDYIKTFADIRWSDYNYKNTVYGNTFTFKHYSKPNYWYYDHLKKYHRYNFRKNVLKEKFPDIYDDNLSEMKIMDNSKYIRVWDCGNIVFEWFKNNKD